MPSSIFAVAFRDVHTHQESTDFEDAQTPEMAENLVIEKYGYYNIDILEVERL